MQIYPLVSVIIIHFNQLDFIDATIDSVVKQSYPNLEIILLDNSASILSRKKLNELYLNYPQINCIYNLENLGLNKAFNIGLEISRGKYCIDLSADDILKPDAIELQVSFFEKQKANVFLVFANSYTFTSSDTTIRVHYSSEDLEKGIPSGNVYENVLQSYFISTPTIIYNATLLKFLNGYDEDLVFEDFDIAVRASRLFEFKYLNEIVIEKRDHPDSMSKRFFSRLKNENYLHSVLKVIDKAIILNISEAENKALAHRILYHLKLSVYTNQKKIAFEFYQRLLRLKYFIFQGRIFLLLLKLPFGLEKPYRFYL